MAKLDKCFDSGVQHCSETDLVRVNVLSTTLRISLIDPEKIVFVRYCKTQHSFFFFIFLFFYKSGLNLANKYKKVQVGNDIRKKSPTPKIEVGKTKLTIRNLYHENIS